MSKEKKKKKRERFNLDFWDKYKQIYLLKEKKKINKKTVRENVIYFALFYFMKCKLCFNSKYTVVKAAGGLQIYKT